MLACRLWSIWIAQPLAPQGGFGEVAQGQANPLGAPSIQSVEREAREGGYDENIWDATKRMTTWQKRDWQQFYELSRRPWRRHRPPRPVYPTGMNRVLPAAGFSLSELDDAGVDLDLAERLGLPVDAGRIGAYGPNVTVLRDFVRSSRQPV